MLQEDDNEDSPNRAPSRVVTNDQACQLGEYWGDTDLFLSLQPSSLPLQPSSLPSLSSAWTAAVLQPVLHRTTQLLCAYSLTYRLFNLLAGKVLMLQVDSLLCGRRKMPYLNKQLFLL